LYDGQQNSSLSGQWGDKRFLLWPMQMGFMVVQAQPCPSCSGGLRFLWITLLKTLAENKFAYFFILFRLWKLVRNFKIINEINGLFPVHSFFPFKLGHLSSSLRLWNTQQKCVSGGLFPLGKKLDFCAHELH